MSHDAASALDMLRETGAAAVMVARAALNRPWVFREIAAALRGEPIPGPPDLSEQRALLLEHHAAMCELEGDRWGTVLMRKFACRYSAGAIGARSFREAITRAESAAEFRDIVERLFPHEFASAAMAADGAPLEEPACA